jgi:ATP phosphoribosyltransferase
MTQKQENQLVMALSKGRILDETLPLLAAAGIMPLESVQKSRALRFKTNVDGFELIILRASDVPTFVAYGAADLGVAGKDVLVEQSHLGVLEPLDLGIARCRMMVAGLVGQKIPTDTRLKVATKYPEIARQHFLKQHRQVDIIKLYGAMELAPVVGLADLIVDLVDTGNTLKANGLEPLEAIFEVSSRLIVNKSAAKTKRALMQPWLDRLKTVVLSQAKGLE